MVGIVGTRRSDAEADAFAHELARRIGAAGVGIVSGGARGIDAAAHRGALEAGAPTLAILAHHPAWSYPPRHAELFARIVRAGGGLLGEHDDHRALRPYFLQRNRLIAALAEALVVIQAPRRSGALSTARVALALGRPVFVVPTSPWDPRGGGNLWLLDQGARVLTRAEPLAVQLELPLAKRPRRSKRRGSAEPAVGPLARSIWRLLGARPRHPDELAAESGEPLPAVVRALMELAVVGAARPVEGSRYVRSDPPGA